MPICRASEFRQSPFAQLGAKYWLIELGDHE